MNNHIQTPAFIISETQLLANLRLLEQIKQQSGCKVLYAIKALPLQHVLDIAKPFVDGFAVSSLYEANLAHDILDGNGDIHLTTPALVASELYELTALCSHINFNSLSHHHRYATIVETQASIGLRVNPKLSFLKDSRFDPCRHYSKLGVDIDTLWHSNQIEQINGLHFHTVFSATNYTPLIKIIEKLRHYFGHALGKLAWLNFGGGYLFHSIAQHQPFIDLVKQLRHDLNVDIYIEPGNHVVGNIAVLVASVIDCFESDGKQIAVLDTSVNHLPEVFEYQQTPDIYEHTLNGQHRSILVGGTCLAGDIFGEYRFNYPLKIGDKITFKNTGAYTLVKAHRFNGHNLPSIYLEQANSSLTLIKQYHYSDYQQQWQATPSPQC
jgi:carboxynorspermidine decarboxylase